MKNIELYYIDTNKIPENFNTEELFQYSEDKEFKSEKRKLQFCLGRFLVHKTLYKYGIKNPKILIKNNKPYIENEQIHFNISHSKNIVLAAFFKNPIGVDIEFMQDRDFKKILKHLKAQTKDFSKENFYRFWTQYEAKIKLQTEPESIHTQQIFENFMISVCTSQPFDIKNNLSIEEYTL